MATLRHCAAILAMGAAIWVGLPAALAQGPAAATVNAFAYHALPAGAAIDVQAMDDTKFNLRVREAFVRELAGRAHGPDRSGARFALEFETLGQFQAARRDQLGEVQVDSTMGSSLRLKMWSTTGHSLLSRRSAGQPSGRFLIVAVLYDRLEKRRVWEARASGPADAHDDFSTSRKLVSLLADSLGETVRNQTFVID